MNLRVDKSVPIAPTPDATPCAPPAPVLPSGEVGLAPLGPPPRAGALRAPGMSEGERANAKLVDKVETLLRTSLSEIPFGIDPHQLATWMASRDPASQTRATLLILANVADVGDAHVQIFVEELKKQIDKALVSAVAHARVAPAVRDALQSLRLACKPSPLTTEERREVNAAVIALEAGAPKLEPHLVELLKLVPDAEAQLEAFEDGSLEGKGSLSGELAGGAVPGLGQAQAFHQLPQALRDAASGGWAEWLGLAGTMAAVIPPLGFMREGTILSHAALREATVLSGVAESGLKHAAKVLSEEGAVKARQELKVLNVARAELIARIDTLRHPTEVLAERYGTFKNCIADHLNAEDLVGGLRDALGLNVRKPGSGKVFKHKQEVMEALGSLDSTVSLTRKYPDAPHAKLMVDGLKELKRRVLAFMEIR